MRRIQFFEFNDAEWTPAPLRRTIVELLHHLALKLRMYEAGFDIVADIVRQTGAPSVQLLCAGGGGGALVLADKLGDIRIVLSDLLPEVEAYRALGATNPRIEHLPTPVDVRSVPASMVGVRLIVNAVHHLPPDAVRAALQDAVTKRQPIVFMEPVQRELGPLLRFVVASPALCVALSLGWARPFSLRRLILGAVIPVGTAAFVFDGVVSHLRAYTFDEWARIVEALADGGTFTWKTTQVQGALGARVNVLTGVPA